MVVLPSRSWDIRPLTVETRRCSETLEPSTKLYTPVFKRAGVVNAEELLLHIFLLEVRATVQWCPGMRCSTKFGIYWHCSAASVTLGLCLLVLWWWFLCLVTFVLCLIWIGKNQILCCFTDWIQKLPHRVTEYRKCFSNKVSVSAKALVTRLLSKVLPVVSLAYFYWRECEMSF